MELLLNDSDEEDDKLFEHVTVMTAEGQLPGFNWSDDFGVNDNKQRVRRPNKHRDFEAGYRLFQRFYFSRFPVYVGRNFERRFRMPRRIFERINNELHAKYVFVN